MIKNIKISNWRQFDNIDIDSIKDIEHLELDLPNAYKPIGELSYISNRSRKSN